MTTKDRRPTLRILVRAHLSFLMIIWLALAVISALISTGLSRWDPLHDSTWYTVGTQVPRWFLLGLGVDAITTYLRLHIAHGRTRRDFLRQLWPYALVLSAASGLLAAVGFFVESAAYGLTRLPAGLVFADTTAFFAIFGAYALVFLLWTAVGVLLGAAFVHNALLGVATIPLAVLVVLPGEMLLRVNGVPLFADLSTRLDLPVLANVGLAAGTLALAGAAVWAISRDMPMRPKVA
jgi:hypothetical protein